MIVLNRNFMSDVTSRAIMNKWDDLGPDEESQRTRDLREELAQLWKLVESKVNTR